jgi:hypothetical protein
MTFQESKQFLYTSISNRNIDSTIAALEHMKPGADVPDLRKKVSDIFSSDLTTMNMQDELINIIGLDSSTGIALPVSQTSIIYALVFVFVAGTIFVIGRVRKRKSRRK